MIRILIRASKVYRIVLNAGKNLVLISNAFPFPPTYDLLLENASFILLENSMTKIKQEGHP